MINTVGRQTRKRAIFLVIIVSSDILHLDTFRKGVLGFNILVLLTPLMPEVNMLDVRSFCG